MQYIDCTILQDNQYTTDGMCIYKRKIKYINNYKYEEVEIYLTFKIGSMFLSQVLCPKISSSGGSILELI